ncbi:tripartite tricarboxylate transporter TctB family protein [Ewingella sp. S1.OA.A_B6]
MCKQNNVVGAVSIIFGIAIIFFSRNMDMFDHAGIPGDRFWPFCLAWLLIGLGILQWIDVYKKRAASDAAVDLSSPAVRKVYLVTGIMAVYAVALCYAGFIASSLILIPVIMRIMGEKRPVFIFIASVLIVACIYVAFTVVFNSPLPESIFSE